ncbi:MAG: NAD(+) synthase, partial [Bacteroidales bacterium]|nr:NAD(+) synthase [Bacteroidales bacterium]
IATEGGAAALGRDDLGAAAVGKTADLILISEDRPSMRPLWNRKAALAYSADRACCVVYCNAGFGESTADAVYDGAAFVVENGKLLAEAERFCLAAQILYAEVRLPLIPCEKAFAAAFRALPDLNSPRPFIPDDAAQRAQRCAEIFQIQVMGLVSRMVHIGCRKVVLGVSGGLDSTLALLVCCKAFDRMGLPRRDILAVTMPGFGTTSRTKGNASALMEALGTTAREVDIRASVSLHFRDIGYDAERRDVTFENAQARERTQILMDMANDAGGLVVGTGDLSEIALGWCTYNGDHMAMYGVNAGVPKTLMQWMVRRAAETDFPEAGPILRDIVDTPISPELLPGVQPTESLVGPYLLHDYFLFRFVHEGEGPAQIRASARQAFSGICDADTIDRWLRVFVRRFLTQQFKRSCAPDAPAVGSVSLSARGGFPFPSDVSASPWLSDLD